ncbi:MAG: family 20 glycosylhydrolase, partial [Bacteroidales bacterium]|nr:family 20 glycosylhydrolase [Bacteroidales bacterium]
ITGVDSNGLFFGMQTLLQLFPPVVETCDGAAEKLQAKCVEIKDWPAFHYRGMHLDPCRHFESIEFVKKQLDVMAMYKFNKMHWHLTEDQGWRLEIKSYPKLTQFGPYYTQDEVREVIAYAAERHIEIIPEFDLPGHCLVAISAYPWLSCKDFKVKPREVWGIDDIVLCPGKESTFTFLEAVLSEMAELFPCEYFHVGGDECPKTKWKICPDCQKKIKELGLVKTGKSSAEDLLQTYVLTRAQAILCKYNKTVIGWDELLEGNPAKDAVIMSWRGNQGGIEGTSRGHRCIMTASKQGMYIDYPQGDIKVEPVASAHYNPLSHTYAYNPIPDEVAEAGNQDLILGCQCNTWSEYMYTEALAEYYIYPRSLAVAETAWCKYEAKDYDYFVKRLDSDAALRLDAHHINYHIPLPEQPFGSREKEAFTESIDVEFTSTRPIKMVYTLDGSEPTLESTIYTGPIHFTESGIIKIASVYAPNNRMSASRTIYVNKEEVIPATPIDTLSLASGLRIAKTTVINVNDISVKECDALRFLVPFSRNDREFLNYKAVAEGYFSVSETGTYYFSSNLESVTIDGIKLINNENECKRNSHHDGALILEKGFHHVRVVFSSDTIGGYPSPKGDMSLYIRPASEEKFSKVLKFWN